MPLEELVRRYGFAARARVSACNVAVLEKQAEALVGLKLTTSRRGAYALPATKNYVGMLAPFAPKS